jgi:hypothetical protein
MQVVQPVQVMMSVMKSFAHSLAFWTLRFIIQHYSNKNSHMQKSSYKNLRSALCCTHAELYFVIGRVHNGSRR